MPNRVRVAVRLRPRNAEELVSDVDFADCVELQPEVCCTYSPWILAILLLHQTSTKFECQFLQNSAAMIQCPLGIAAEYMSDANV